jgi:hypothetical protein
VRFYNDVTAAVDPNRFIIALISLLILSSASARSDTAMRSSDAGIAKAVDYCSDQLPGPSIHYHLRSATIVSMNDDRTVLCFDGTLDNDLDRSPFELLQERGFLVIRSLGGYMHVAMPLSNILRAKDITVIIRDFCFSACANAFFVATQRTYVLKNAVVAWHGNLSTCEQPKIRYALERVEMPCFSYDHTGHFYRSRGIDPLPTLMPMTRYAESRFRIVLDSAFSKRSVFWMWHPKNHGNHFKGRVIYESYPESQADVDSVIRRFGLHVRVVHDPAD